MKQDFYALVDIIKKLRSEDGCPWDREQSHESLKKHLIEEAYETADAINEKDPQKIADELGDVLLQVVLHAQIGSEEQSFDINDVTDAICKKMIVRHPHIFGDKKVNSAEDVLRNWEEIKKEERKEKSISEGMMSISKGLPSLMRAEKIQNKAAKLGVDSKDMNEAAMEFEKVALNLKNAVDTNGDISGAISEVLFALVCVSRKAHVNCEDILAEKNEKFVKSFKIIEEKTCKN